MFQHDLGHSGRSSYVGPHSVPIFERCRFAANQEVIGSPVIASDGTIYLPGGSIPNGSPTTAVLFALNPDCTQKWAAPLPGPPGSTTPALAADGTIYVHVNGMANVAAIERLVALRPDGSQKWAFEFNLGAGIFVTKNHSSPAVAADGTIWVSSMDTRLWALNPNGTVKCSVSPTASSITSAPALSADGQTVYVLDGGGPLVAYTTGCSERWRYSFGSSNADQSPAVGPDGSIYVVHGSDLYSISTAGAKNWNYTTTDPFVLDTTPAFGADGTVYLAADGLYALNPAGTLQWKRGCTSSSYSHASPLVGADGTIYFRDAAGEAFGARSKVCAFTPAGNPVFAVSALPAYSGHLDPNLAISRTGDLYVGEGGQPDFGTAVPTVFRVLAGAAPARPTPDFNADGATEVSVFRPSAGTWYVRNGTNTSLGGPGDIPVPGDYDRDGRTDVAVYRSSVGGWYRSGAPTTFFGVSGDTPVPGDYDGDGRTDIAVYRPSVGGWYRQGGPTTFFGLSGDIPVPGDYDGDGKTDIAVYRPSVGGWYRQGGPTTFSGLSGDIPVPGDYDANGRTDVAVYRPSVGAWYVGAGAPIFFGIAGDLPLPLPAAIRMAAFP